MKSRSIAGWLAPFLLVPLLGCTEEPAPAPEVVRPIKMLEIGGAGDTSRREYPGTVAATQSAELAFEVPGKLTEFPVQEGQEVEAGTVLAKIDPRDYAARLDKANAKVNYARTEFERARKLFEEGVTASAEVDRKERQLEVTQADLREAEKAVEDTLLRAPFAGVVARKLVKDFENVQAKQGVVLLEDNSSLEIVIDIPERDVVQGTPDSDPEEITRRLEPRVKLSSLPDREIPARAKEFSTSADPNTRTFKGTLTFDPPEGIRVLPGMTATVSINAPRELRTGGALTIPSGAVLADEQGRSYVWLVDAAGMTVSRRPVGVGGLQEDRIAIGSGLREGDLVAISGVHHLRDGMKVSRIDD